VTESAVISIVDDDAFARRGLGDLILSLGYRARTFVSAEEFLQSGRIDETSCLITDLHMPGLSGLDLLSRLRREGRRIPVILVTDDRSESHRARALAEGAIGFLFKPFVEQSLIDCLATAIEPERLKA
jgi:FixJ family two-component response regulator